MARPLPTGLTSPPGASLTPEERPPSGRLDRAAARAFAAAISSLIIATLVVSHSAQALDPEGTVAANSVAAGTVTLVDDDQGRSLVNLNDMAPGRPVEECIVVSYEGSVLPVDVSLLATVTGSLADHLLVAVERGTGGRFSSCDDFVPAEQVYSGTAGQFGRTEPIRVATVRNQYEDIAFRFRFEVLDDAEAVGQASAIDFVWEAVPS